MSTMCPFLTVPCRVGLQFVIAAFLGHILSCFEAVIIVYDKTIVFHKIEL